MLDKSSISFGLLVENKKEKLFINFKNKEFKESFENSFGEIDFLVEEKTLGYALCSILNSRKEIDKLFEDIKNNIENYIKIDNTDNVKIEGKNIFFNSSSKTRNEYNTFLENNIYSIFKKVLEINKYFLITFEKFKEYIDNINSCLENLSGIKSEEKRKAIYQIYRDKLFHSNKINWLTDSLFLFEDQIIHNSRCRFNLPATEVIYNFENNETKNTKLPSNCINQYFYSIKGLWEFYNVSYYHILLNNTYIRQCKYPTCKKYYTTQSGQTRYCDNICPDDLSQTYTCKKIRKTISSDYDMKDWEEEVYDLKIKFNTVREYFRYSSTRKEYISKKQAISNNKKILSKNMKDFFTLIKNDTNPYHYIKICDEYISEIKQNAKNGNFKVKRLDFKTLLKNNKKS